jgi:hypothetical protein
VLTEEKLDGRGPDFFFWGYLKDTVYSNNPRIEEELKKKTFVRKFQIFL